MVEELAYIEDCVKVERIKITKPTKLLASKPCWLFNLHTLAEEAKTLVDNWSECFSPGHNYCLGLRLHLLKIERIPIRYSVYLQAYFVVDFGYRFVVIVGFSESYFEPTVVL